MTEDDARARIQSAIDQYGPHAGMQGPKAIEGVDCVGRKSGGQGAYPKIRRDAFGQVRNNSTKERRLN